MLFKNNIDYFDNNDSLELYYYLLEKGLNSEQVKLISCTKFHNRVNIKVILDEYEIIICPNLTMWHWFSVSKTKLNSDVEINNNDIREFSAIKEHFHELLNFIYEDTNIFKFIKQIKNNIKNMNGKIQNFIDSE